MPVSYTPIPYPQPTPYQSPSQGGNPYVSPGTIGTSIPQSWQPVYGPQPQGQTQWNSGAVTSSGGGTSYKAPTNSNPVPYSGGSGGQVAGSSVVNNQNNSNGGGPGDSRLQQLEKMSRNPVQEQEYQSLLSQLNIPSGPSDEELNTAYDPIFNYLNQAEAGLGVAYNNQNALYDQQAATAKGDLAVNKQNTLNTISTAKQKAGQRKEDVITSSRRAYGELAMANRQRFGGATSAGDAASELQSIEMQRSLAGAQRGFEDTMREISTKEVEVENLYQVENRKIDDSIVQAKQNAYSEFQNGLLEIGRQRATTASEKANRKLLALDQYKNQLFQLQVQEQQNRQALENWKQQQDYSLGIYKQQLSAQGQGAGTAYSNYTQNTTTNPTSNMTVGSQNRSQVPTYTGYKTTDELQGYAPGIYDQNKNQIGSGYQPIMAS